MSGFSISASLNSAAESTQCFVGDVITFLLSQAVNNKYKEEFTARNLRYSGTNVAHSCSLTRRATDPPYMADVRCVYSTYALFWYMCPTAR